MSAKGRFLRASNVGAEIFASGKSSASRNREHMPQYAHEVNGDLVLNSESIAEPSTFLIALRDYCRMAAKKTLNPAEFLSFDKEPDDTLYRAREILERSARVHRVELSRDSISSLMNGYASELVVADSIRNMLLQFRRDTNGIPNLMEWNSDQVQLRVPVKTDRGFSVIPVGQTNTIVLGHHLDNQLPTIGEVDLIIETPDRVACLVDVTTSENRLLTKLEESRNELTFEKFRRKVADIFKQTDGESGYRDMQKVHVVCKDGPLGKDYFSLGLDEHIHVFRVDRRNHVEELSAAITSELQRLKLLSFDRHGSPRIHNTNGTLPMAEVN